MKKSCIVLLIALSLLTRQSFSQQTKAARPTTDRAPANTIAIEGHVVSAAFAGIGNAPGIDDLLYLIMGCCCVKMPCDCAGDQGKLPIIFGMRSSDVLKVSKSQKTTVTGKPVSLIYVRKDAVIQGPVMTLVAGNKLASVTPVNGISSSGPNGTPSAVASIQQVAQAFVIGYTLGTKIDELTGVSGSLAQLWWEALEGNVKGPGKK
jgi:hypothetical protein